MNVAGLAARYLRAAADALDPPARSGPTPSSYGRWIRAIDTGRCDPLRAVIYPALMARGWTMAQLSIQSGVPENALAESLSLAAHRGRAISQKSLERVERAARTLGIAHEVSRVLDTIDHHP